jgi:Protein of unknown function (DUF3618)
MDPSRSRTHTTDRVAEIRADIAATRTRLAETLEALRFKTDLPARLGDLVGNAALTFTEHILDRVTSAREDEVTEEHLVPMRTSTESAPSEADERSAYSDPTPTPG